MLITCSTVATWPSSLPLRATLLVDSPGPSECWATKLAGTTACGTPGTLCTPIARCYLRASRRHVPHSRAWQWPLWLQKRIIQAPPECLLWPLLVCTQCHSACLSSAPLKDFPCFHREAQDYVAIGEVRPGTTTTFQSAQNIWKNQSACLVAISQPHAAQSRSAFS